MKVMEYNGPLVTEEYYEYYDYYYNYTYEQNETFHDEEDVAGEFLSIFSVVSYTLIFSVSLAGNSFLLWALLKREDLRRTSNQLLLHLVASDLIITIPIPMSIASAHHSWMMTDVTCRLLSGTLFLGTYSYMVFLTAMTVYRYMAVVHAVTASSYKPNIHLLSGVLWVFCLAFSVPNIVFSKTATTRDNDVYCIQDYESLVTVCVIYYVEIIIFFLLPFAVITFCYSRMWFRIKQCRLAKKRKTTRLILLIVVCFFICWMPYNICLFLELLKFHEVIAEEILDTSEAFFLCYIVSNILAFSHCCLSPVIHIFGAGKFRKRLRRSGLFRLQLSVRERTRTLSNTQESALSASGQASI